MERLGRGRRLCTADADEAIGAGETHNNALGDGLGYATSHESAHERRAHPKDFDTLFWPSCCESYPVLQTCTSRSGVAVKAIGAPSYLLDRLAAKPSDAG